MSEGVARTGRRVRVLQGIGLSLMVLLGGRLAYLQSVDSDAYAAAADANTIREVVTPAPRGLILDVAGRPLVQNRTQLQITVDRTNLSRQPDRGAAVLDRLGRVLGVSADDLRAQIRPCGAGVTAPCWNGSPYQPVPVAVDVDSRVAMQVLEFRERFPGVDAVSVSVRNYPQEGKAKLAHVLGYLQPADEKDVAAQKEAGLRDPRLGVANLVGRAGLEKQYDALLRGAPGVTRVTVDHLGHVLQTVEAAAPRPGNNLLTSIDAKVQAIAERALAEGIERARNVPDYRGRRYAADSGAIVVLDSTNGAVVAMAGAPTFNLSDWVGGIDAKTYAKLVSDQAGTPLLARPYAAADPPGSLFKVISTAAAAKAGYDLDATYPCPSSYTVGNQTFKNYESHAYGNITLARALEVSCDTVFYRIAHEMWLRDGAENPVADPADPMQRMAEIFGLGRPTGIDLPGEIGGRIASREFKQSYWEQTREATCGRAGAANADRAAVYGDDAARAAFLHQLDRENCIDGAKWRAGDAVNFSIGQGDTMTTPLQMARVYAAIANGGTLWRPRVAQAELTPDGDVVRRFAPVSDGKVDVSPKVLKYLLAALEGTSRSGTAAGVFAGWPLVEMPVGAKTGTAERFGEDPTSWFVGFAGPEGDRSRYVAVMTVSQGGTGSGTSGPGVRSVLSAMLGVDRAAVWPNGLPPALPGRVEEQDGSE